MSDKEQKVEVKEEVTTKKTTPKKSENLVIVRVRGVININSQLKSTFDMLNLINKNGCVVVKNNPVNVGMINKVKDYVTWGELDESVHKELMEKKADEFKSRTEDSKKLYKYNFVEYNKKKYKKFIRLHPPRKGYGKNGIKKSFKEGGALGNRGSKINDLLKNMM
jgi:large subunit ribosomal protein L30